MRTTKVKPYSKSMNLKGAEQMLKRDEGKHTYNSPSIQSVYDELMLKSKSFRESTPRSQETRAKKLHTMRMNKVRTQGMLKKQLEKDSSPYTTIFDRATKKQNAKAIIFHEYGLYRLERGYIRKGTQEIVDAPTIYFKSEERAIKSAQEFLKKHE